MQWKSESVFEGRRSDIVEQIRDGQMRKILSELAELMRQVYGDKLKSVILYGSVARGTDTEDSDIDIMVLIDGDASELRQYDERLCDASTEISLKYLKVFSIVDVSYQEYMEWRQILPFYRNVSEEGVVLYAA